jgi:hypothetical protein
MTPEIRTRVLQTAGSLARRRIAVLAAALMIATIAAGAVWVVTRIAAPSASQLTTMLPRGALLTIEARDFSTVLKRWSGSPEKQAWLKSDNYAVFSRSRLFTRLGDAQADFARAAGLPPDMNFLSEVAGTQSVFAWYDIGHLEFLYITRMPADQAEKTRLVQLRSKFTSRQASGQTFYIRNSASPGITIPSEGDATQPADGTNDAGGGEIRTVAFATVGDWLILATREDLMAGALMLMNESKAGAASADSLAAEPWFIEAHSAAAKETGDLRMTLNLDRIVPSPYFRTYWVQRNITEMKQYRSAVADLYLSTPDFREERVLLARTSPDVVRMDGDLRALTALLPDHTGVYRATASPETEAALASLDEKLLARSAGTYNDSRYAPQADVSGQNTGSASELETRIDAPATAVPAKGSELDLLRHALDGAELTAMMTVNRTGPARDGVWVPFSSGVVLSAAKPWDQPAMHAALKQAVAARLTAGNLGLDWRAVQAASAGYFEISDTRPLELAFRGNLCIITDDPALMRDMLGRASQPSQRQSNTASHETLIAGFDLTRERAPFARWTNIVDRVGQRNPATRNGRADDGSDDAGSGGEPGFFARNMRGLGTVFSALQSEEIVERRDGPLVRQTVTYAWKQ